MQQSVLPDADASLVRDTIQKDDINKDLSRHQGSLSEVNAPPGPSKPMLPGIARVEAAASQLTQTKRWTLFIFIFIFGYAFGLDSLVRNTYVAYATSSMQNHSLLATVNVIQGVVGAAIQPSVAKLTDAFGRFEVFALGVALYTIGTVVQAAAVNITGLSAGAVLTQLGYSIFFLTLDIIIADFTSMKTRLFFSYIPSLSFIINTWVSGDVTSAVLALTSWKWGIGMFAIIIPGCAMPLIWLLFMLGYQAKRTQIDQNKEHLTLLPSLGTLIWELDLIGILLLTGSLALILIPLTLAGGNSSKWNQAGILTPIILGVLLLPAFVVWEQKTSSPLLPGYLMTDWTVWGCITINIFYAFGLMCHESYLFTLLIVSYNFSLLSATRVASLWTFSSVVTAFIVSLVIIKVRRLKGFIIGGISLSFVGYGLAYHYRGDTSSQSGVIGAEIVIGVGSGLFAYSTLVLGQTAARHQDIGVLIATLFTCNTVGRALGSCISGAIWTQTLYDELSQNLAPFGNATLASAIYAAPLNVVPDYPVGTVERDAIIHSYRYIQRLLTITSFCIYVPMLLFALFLRDPRLSDLQMQPEANARAAGGVEKPRWLHNHWFLPWRRQ
ncbi:hypothetical protein H2204_009914 [Knufia peltigerae]|uniref:Uncharacterized protein n=1 Tax=Knufia peltigerae TaxID=1002370 RepID=A0AA38XY24_9EURO|nr:hypothetical protein H2204_009914 [Knufia peltigerae]